MDFHSLSRPVSFSVPPAPLRFVAKCGSADFQWPALSPSSPTWFGVHDGVIIAACDVVVGDGARLAWMRVMVDGFREAMGVKHCGTSGRVALLFFIRF